MLPTVCQACGGPIGHRERGSFDNPNVCDVCARIWEEEESTLTVAAHASEPDTQREDDAGGDQAREAV